jgi:hypothetical protein
MNKGQGLLSSDSAGALMRIHQNTSVNQPVQPTDEEDVIIFEDSSETDSSMSASDDENEDEGRGIVSAATATAPVTNPSPRYGSSSDANGENAMKRKLSAHASEGLTSAVSLKRVKLDEHDPGWSDSTAFLPSDKSLLPAEIWHYIFTFVSPQGLGNLLQVNKLYNSYLDPFSLLQGDLPIASTDGHLSALQPNAIWRAARKRYWPKMPAPLKERTELDMWRLVHRKTCQFCDKMAQGTVSVVNAKSKPGPGSEGIKLIWPFAIRACGPCLMTNSTKVCTGVVSRGIECN